LSLPKLVLEVMSFLLLIATTSSIILFLPVTQRFCLFSLKYEKGCSWHALQCLPVIFLHCIWLLFSNILLKMSLLCFTKTKS
jgi:hypothetical protein